MSIDPLVCGSFDFRVGGTVCIHGINCCPTCFPAFAPPSIDSVRPFVAPLVPLPDILGPACPPRSRLSTRLRR